MKKVFRYFLFIVLLLSILNVRIINVTAATTYKIDSGGNYYFDYVSNVEESYYSSLEGLSDGEFRTELHKIISSGNLIQFGYDDLKEELKELDEDPNNSNNILCVLTGKSLNKNSFGGSGNIYWNREHIWPKSHGFNDEDLTPYTDLHHLRAAEAYTNSTFHNDYDYGMVNDGVKDDFGNKYVNKTDSSTGYGKYEPRNAVKGDIARMVMYMDIRYEGDELSDLINLTITSGGTSPSESSGYIGDLDTLISWHEQDPVDDLERRRNDNVYIKQGNRNPFIDHPEYANTIYGANYNLKDTDEYRVIYYVEHGQFSYVDINSYKIGDKIVMPEISPVSSRYDHTFGGWLTESGEIFDFENDTIDSNLKLYASWTYTPLPATEMIERSKTLTGLHLVYENKKIEEKPVLQKTKVTIDPTQYSSTGLKKNTVKSYDEFLEYNKQDIQILYESNNKTSAYVGKGVIRLYPGNGKGTGLRIEARDGGPAKIVDVQFITNFKGDLSASLEKTIDTNGDFIYLQNVINENTGTTNQINFTSLEITYYVDTIDVEPIFDSVGLVFGFELSNDLFDDLIANGTIVQFGIKIDGIEYIVEVVENNGLKKIVKEIIVSDFNKKFTAQAFVKIDDTYYYATSVTNSVKTIAETYISNHIDNTLVYDNRLIIKYLINN